MGFAQKIHTIRSYEKLSSEGMNVTGKELLDLVEEVLPGRFGGQPTDYQFVEEFSNGLSRISLFVSPRIGQVSETAMLETVYSFLIGQKSSHVITREIWEQGATLRLVRQEPLATAVSKIQALHVLH